MERDRERNVETPSEKAAYANRGESNARFVSKGPITDTGGRWAFKQERRRMIAGSYPALRAPADGSKAQPGLHAGRGPRGYVRRDDLIDEDINERLTEDPRIDATNVEVQVSEGEVTLAGQVGARDEKHRAEEIAQDVLGVRRVQNNLRVEAGDEYGGRTSPP